MTTEQMTAIADRLAAPFPADDVNWRPAGKGGANQRTTVVAYVDARAVQDRLDAVLGPLGWSFDWQPIHVDDKGDVTIAKGPLTVGGVSKTAVGPAPRVGP